MRTLLNSLFACGLLAAGFLLSSGTVRAADDKAIDLLPGGDASQHWNTKGNWVTADGAITLKPRAGEKGWSRWDMYLWSKIEYSDFEIEFDYKVDKSGNSGFYFRVGDVNNPVAKGIEVQIYDSHPKGTEKKLTDHDSGGVIPGVPPTKNTAKPAGEWNTFVIRSQNDKLTVKLNGEVVNEIDLSSGKLAERPKKGFIGFQDHAMPLSLRNIKIREL